MTCYSVFVQGLKVIDLQQSDYMRTLESAIQFGLPVVLQNVQEKLDPSLDPVLNKSLMRIGRDLLIQVLNRKDTNLLVQVSDK